MRNKQQESKLANKMGVGKDFKPGELITKFNNTKNKINSLPPKKKIGLYGLI